MDKILIPHSLQITMDDLGWFCGTDDRKTFGPARSGMPRRHRAEDYAAVNELGSRLDMRINCAFIMGEWDPDNRLRKIPHFSKYGDGWDNAAHFDGKEAARCAEVLNNAPYIDMAVHGLIHNNYTPGAEYGNTDYFYKMDGVYHPIEENLVRQRLDAWFDLVNFHGIQKKINSFIAPNFVYQWDFLARILKDYGVLYVSTVFDRIENIDGRSIADVDNGIITIDRNFNRIPWYEVGSDPRKFEPVKGIFGCHWPNVLDMDPEGYAPVLDAWEIYFKSCGEEFGIILSKDIAFSATQSLYKRFAKVVQQQEITRVDLSEVPQAPGLGEAFYISARNPIQEYAGCQLEEYEVHRDFINYRIIPTGKILTFR